MAEKRKLLQAGNAVNQLNTTRRLARGVLAPTPAHMIVRTADAIAAPLIDRAAKRQAERRGGAMPDSASKKKLQGIGFWFMLGLTMIKDFLDIFLNVAFFLVFLIIPIGFMVSFAVFLYLYLQGVKMDTRKLATVTIGFLIDIVPILSILPAFTISLILIRIIENSENKGVVGSITARAKGQI